jgi:hypothetical protein
MVNMGWGSPEITAMQYSINSFSEFLFKQEQHRSRTTTINLLFPHCGKGGRQVEGLGHGGRNWFASRRVMSTPSMLTV